MLGTILIGAAGVLVLFLVVAATRPSAYRVERKGVVAAPPDVVFGVLNDLRQFAGVFVLFRSPLAKVDPKMEKTIEGPAAGVGQSYSWSGKEAGKGKMTIEESVPGQKVTIKLEFMKPMTSTATCAITLARTRSGSHVTWSMAGNHNFIGKALGVVVNMDRAIGADIEQGLAELKTVAEASIAKAPSA